VNPDVSSNRLVREFIEQHCGTTGLSYVELSSDQGLPTLLADRTQVELALIDGNHSHPFPIVDFHYMDQMLRPGGLLLVDNTEIGAVGELIDYLDAEGAYEPERLIGNCAVYRKVRDRAFGWKAQALRRAGEGSELARQELARLRLEVAPELRAALSGSAPLPAAGVSTSLRRHAKSFKTGVTRLSSSDSGSGWRSSPKRLLRQLASWYAAPSGALAGLALLLLAVGVAASGAWRLAGVAGVGLLAVFLPYRFRREQQRNDQQLALLRRDLATVRSDIVGEIRRAVDDASRSINDQTDRRVEAVVASTSIELGALKDAAGELSVKLDETVARTKPSRRFAAAKLEDPSRPELAMRDATTSLLQATTEEAGDESPSS
jgi:hypothetical protein